MPSPMSLSGSNTSMAERSAEKGWTPPGGAGGASMERPKPPRVNDSNGLDAQLWHACAGAMVHLPQVGSKVIYFPQGHAEHAASPPEFPRTIAMAGTMLCRVLSVNFLADKETDEVYARICLQPDPGADPSDDTPPSPPLSEKTTSFAKTLTQSDANNGGGFSVPRYCAETIFPRLDYSEDPPVQIVLAKDVHGAVWRFRHIYRGTPRRHLLTTGWSSFVNQKKLVAGDAIVFLRSASGELCVGVRRSTRGGGVGGVDTSPWYLSSSAPGPPRQTSRWELKPSDSSYDFFGTCTHDGATHTSRASSDVVGVANFARNRSRITAKAVLEAASLAAAGQPFEVVYYPRASISEFCVKANAVKASLQQSWAPGMRFKMAVETEDASRISWFMGTISKVQEADSAHWPNSPWKMLRVTWDEPDLLQGISRVNPWQVELVSPLQLPPFSLPKKKLRLLQPPETFLRDGQGMMGFSMAAFPSNLLGHINPWHGLADTASVGMQGTRQDRSYGLAISDFRPSNMQKTHVFWENFYNNRDPTKMSSGGQVSTELNISNFGSNGHSSERSQLSTLLTVGSGTSEPALKSNGSSWDVRECSSSAKGAPFLLFGKAIDTSQVLKSPPVDQMSGRSSSDGQGGHEIVSECDQSEALDKTHSLVLARAHPNLPFGGFSNMACQEAVFDSASNEVGMSNWFKEQASPVAISTPDILSNHCKVFKESDDVGRTVDLSMFESYEELHERLSLLFGVQKAEVLGRVVCLDLMGSSRPIGEEPYRNFSKRVKRLKILSESSSESFTR